MRCSLFFPALAAGLAGIDDVLAGNWTKLSVGPWSGREGLMVASTQGKLVLTGGRTSSGAGFSDEVWTSADGGSWTLAAKAPWEGRSYHILVGPDANDCIFLMGGQTFKTFFNDVWSSCDAGSTWTEVVSAAPWKGRAGLGGTMHKGKMVITGGCHDNLPYDPGFLRTFFNDVWESTDGKQWDLVTAAAPWKARSGTRLMSFQDRLFIIAGEIGFTDTTQLGDIWSSADGGKNWEMMSSAPGFSARSGHGVVAIGSSLVLIAGWPELSDIYSSTDGAAWKKAAGTAWNCGNAGIRNDSCGKFDFWPVVHDEQLLLIGGSGSRSTFGKLYDETWALPLGAQIDVASIVV
mmetsp:Transcript_3190/g.7188  ORF Transcript_3190/g.7188 Transcript_3190/m.7188 type:complete len:348 (-) Transcript_3190:45-1088(-)|eukprot:CAMPEP_0204393062 /NCGR_PEP_ID=MMETSP0469-20131031/62113_1 /ASSEMBLY_ACC=CAM_ASM_000384 /TAXON_ID=2969 /ORGANISM="Oxyrrhis marina" /LENGTH=347 /DNA_ID=CAMNT_0051387107 /DNA_START=39 /DNA_END=1082 /DNA_ORIENTATION=-